MDTMSSLMPLLRSLSRIWMYTMNEFLDHRPIAMILSGCNLARKRSMTKPDHSECVPTYFLDNPIHSSPK